MEFQPPSPLQNNQEDVLKRAIESVENSILLSEEKLGLTLLLLGRKQGVLLSNRKIETSEEEKRKLIKEFTEQLLEIKKLLKGLDLKYEVIEELSYDSWRTAFSVFVSKEKSILEKFVQAHNENDDKTFGLIEGFPPTAVETYNTDKAFDFRQELPQADLDKLKSEGTLPFLLFSPSREHWAEELEWTKENQRLVKAKAPKLYQELLMAGK